MLRGSSITYSEAVVVRLCPSVGYKLALIIYFPVGQLINPPAKESVSLSRGTLIDELEELVYGKPISKALNRYTK